jgi:diacylglycerol kinase (ATP)
MSAANYIKLSKEPTVYISIPNIDAAQKKALNIPPCCHNACNICTMIFLCCTFTVIAPVILIVFAQNNTLSLDALTNNTLLTCGICFASIGLIWCCCLTSFRTFLLQGVCCVPKGHPPTKTWQANPSVDGEQKTSSPTSMTVKKLKVIVNPNAGVKAGSSNLAKCQKVWEASGVEVEVLNTTHAGHAREFARDEDLTNCDALVAIGGDGTIHELVNGYLSRDDNVVGNTNGLPPLGFIPGGSGNSVMAQQGTWDVEEAAARIAQGQVMRMDIVEVTAGGETIASVNTICFGLTGVIGVVAEDLRCLGPVRYDAVAIWKIMTGIKEFTKMDIEGADGTVYRVEDSMTTVYVNSTQHFGKGKRCAPEAQSNDGLMDVYALKATATRGDLMASLLQLPTASHVNSPVILHWRARKCTITLPTPGVFNVDGEIVKHDGQVVMTCRQQRQPVFADPDSVAMIV